MENFAPNIKGLKIYQCGLLEVHQSDIRVFSNLVHLDLISNEIQFLEEGLFKYNTNLKVIYLSFNNIAYIHPNVFDILSKLSSLNLCVNKCISSSGTTSTDVKKVITQVKAQCPAPQLNSCPKVCSEDVLSCFWI